MSYPARAEGLVNSTLSEISNGKISYVEDSDISSKFSIDISNGWVGRIYKYLAETVGKKEADTVVPR